MRRLAPLLVFLLACSSPLGQEAAGEGRTNAADVATCAPGDSVTRIVTDCVVATDVACPCGLFAYRCSTPGAFSLDTPRGASAGPSGAVCADESTCVRADRYDAQCASAGLGEAYSCPVLADGGTPPLNILWAGTRLDGPTPEGEGAIVCGRP